MDGDTHYVSDGYADIEKVAFPPYGSVPTYTADIKPTYSLPFSLYGSQITSTEHWVTFPEVALQRNMTDVQVYRNNSYESTKSVDNSHSNCQSHSSHSHNGSQDSHTQAKRWVIE